MTERRDGLPRTDSGSGAPAAAKSGPDDQVPSRWDLDPDALPSLLRGPVRFLFTQPPFRFAVLAGVYMSVLYFVGNSVFVIRLKLHYGWDHPCWSLRHSSVDIDHLIKTLFWAPLLEPLHQQMAPALILRVLRCAGWTMVMVMGLIFAILHRAGSGWALIGMGSLGVVLAMTFVFWVRRSWWTAYWVTALAHALYNLVLAVHALFLS